MAETHKRSDPVFQHTPGQNSTEREKLLQGVISSAPISLALIDRDGTIILSAGKGREALSSTRGDTTGKSLFEVYKDIPVVIQYFTAALKGEVLNTFLQIDGYDFESRFTPFSDDDGNIVGVLVVSTDITRHKVAEDALYSSQARFKTIFEESELGISLEDLEGRVIESNPAFQEILGYSAEELMNKPFTDFTHPDDLDVNLELWNSMVAGQRENFRLDKRYIRKDGNIVWGRMTTSLVRGADGKPEAIIVMVDDITAQKLMEAELIEVQRRLMQSREQERLHLAQELHDGPLQDLHAIIFKLKELETSLDDHPSSELLQDVHEDVQHQIQALRAICGELRPPSLVPFGLEKAIRSHAETFMTQHPDMDLSMDLMPDRRLLPEPVRLALFRIYQELLNNVVRHANASQVAIRFSFRDDLVMLEVRDNGEGFGVPKRWIEMARQNHLGLVGAQERAESIGGTLEIESHPGKGTSVRIIVPRQPKEGELPSKEFFPKGIINQPLAWFKETPNA